MAKNNIAPKSVSTKLGKIQFQSFIHANSRILAWAANNGAKLPNSSSMSIATTDPINQYMPKYPGASGSPETNGTKPPVVNLGNSVSMNSIFEVFNRVKAYIENNNTIPKTVGVGSDTYSIHDFLYLLSKAIVNHNPGMTTTGTVLSSCVPSSPSGNNNLAKLYKAEFVNIAKNIVNYYTANKKASNYVESSLRNLQYQSTIYVLARVGAYIQNNKNTIPNYVDVTVDSSSKINGGSGGSSSGKLAEFLKATKNCQLNDAKIQNLARQLTFGLTSELSKAKAIFNYIRDQISYSFYYNTAKGAVGTLNAKSENCVDKNHLMIALLITTGIGVRYVNGMATFSFSGHIGHTWAEIYIDGRWVIADITSSRNTIGNVNNCWNHEIWSKTAEITF
ncbi:hypothetical protein ALNOE001_20280 [Candidatus Methanobinarius endosymbioticus]|uniref:Transglutaminase-like domain-containing protein n=1 Tax=Candidatus Methanobinarius endosymbioticus TaxID=2006182 RepID=A0A366M7T1_9EURY|nr:hypothetical protein ALNOE001_20280 [Candidatus Methanobinarius endosymbioticus]